MKDNKKLLKIDNYKFWEIVFEINKKYRFWKFIINNFFLYIRLKKYKGLMSMRVNKFWVIGN